MKISRVEATFLRNVPITPPPFRAEPSRRNTIVVEVETDDGTTGYALTGNAGDEAMPDASVRFINGAIAELLRGQDPLLIEELWSLMERTHGDRRMRRAIAAIDVALWDIRGKALGHPVWRLLGGARRTVRAYITFGATGPNTGHSDAPPYSREELVEEARYHVGNGQRGLKTGVGRSDPPDVDADAARLSAIRDAVGPGIDLMMDARSRLSVGEAARLCKLCEGLDVTFFEDPVLMNDPQMLADLSRQTTIPLAANLPGGDRRAYREALVRDAIQFVQLNAANIGFTEAVAVAQIARAFDRRIANGNGSGPHNAHFQAGMANGTWVEYHFNTWMLYEALFLSVARPKNGWVGLADTPGFGLDVKPEVIREYRATP